MNIENKMDRDLIRQTIEKILGYKPDSGVLSIDKARDSRFDFIVGVKIGDVRKVLNILFGRSGEPRILRSVIYQLSRIAGGYPVYMAPFISDIGRKILIENNIGFIDLSGNAFISFDNVLIDRRGYENKKKKRRNLKRLFSKKSTRVIRKLLSYPEREWTTSDLAKEAEVSLGYVSMILKNLAEDGFLQRERSSNRVLEPGKLLDWWAGEYRFDEQDLTGYYVSIEDRETLFGILRTIDKNIYALTMGAAASIKAPFVRSTDTYLYSTSHSVLEEELDLAPVEFGGNLYLIKPYDKGVLFDKQIINGLSLVSDIQLYIDLYGYPARGKEQAEYLREEVMTI